MVISHFFLILCLFNIYFFILCWTLWIVHSRGYRLCYLPLSTFCSDGQLKYWWNHLELTTAWFGPWLGQVSGFALTSRVQPLLLGHRFPEVSTESPQQSLKCLYSNWAWTPTSPKHWAASKISAPRGSSLIDFPESHTTHAQLRGQPRP